MASRAEVLNKLCDYLKQAEGCMQSILDGDNDIDTIRDALKFLELADNSVTDLERLDMNRHGLDSLLGSNYKDAEKIILKYGLKSRSYHKDQAVIIDLSLPSDVVEIRYNDNDIVESAETQKSIEAKY